MRVNHPEDGCYGAYPKLRARLEKAEAEVAACDGHAYLRDQIEQQQQWLDEINVALGPGATQIVSNEDRLARIEGLKGGIRNLTDVYEAKLDGAEGRAKLVLAASDRWADRARAAEAKVKAALAEVGDKCFCISIAPETHFGIAHVAICIPCRVRKALRDDAIPQGWEKPMADALQGDTDAK